jgi:hypothetical protein
VLQFPEAKREATTFSPFFAAEILGSPPLHSSLRRRERKGTPDSCAWRVDRCRIGGLSGVALVAAAAARPIKVPEFQPHLGVVGSDAEELVGVWFLGAVGVAVAAAALGILVLSLFPRFDGDCSDAVEELWRILYRSLLQKHLGVFLLWFGSAEEGWRLRFPWRWLGAARMRLRWLGDVSPPMLGQRLRFRRSRRMDLAVLQRSMSAIEPRLLLGLWWTRVRPLRWRPAAGGDRHGRVAWWLGLRTCKDLFVLFLFVRVLFALSPGQVAFGLFLVCACVCGFCTRL